MANRLNGSFKYLVFLFYVTATLTNYLSAFVDPIIDGVSTSCGDISFGFSNEFESFRNGMNLKKDTNKPKYLRIILYYLLQKQKKCDIITIKDKPR